VVAAPLDDFTKSKNSPLRFQPVNQFERQRLVQQRQAVQRLLQQRQTLETNAAGARAEVQLKALAPARVTLPTSPIVARPVTELGKDHAPPQMRQAPKPDLRVAPKPRVNRPAPQPQRRPQAERPALQPRGDSAGPNRDKSKDKGKGKGKGKGK
jgi:hypothetical protein